MAAAFTEAAITYADTGSFTVAGKWISGEPGSIIIGAPNHHYEFITTPGVEGCGTKYFGFRDQQIALKVVYVSPTEAAILADWYSDMHALGIAPQTLTVGTSVFYACILNPATSIGKVKDVGVPGGMFHAEATIIVNSKRNFA